MEALEEFNLVHNRTNDLEMRALVTAFEKQRVLVKMLRGDLNWEDEI